MENDFGSNKTRENVPRPIDEVFNEPRQILLPPVISWKDGSSIVFTSIGSRNSVPLYTAKLYFCDNDGVTKERNLTTITGSEPCYFTGSKDFYSDDSELNCYLEGYYVIGIAPDKLINDQKCLLDLSHELGHVIVFKENADIKLVEAGVNKDSEMLPQYVGILNYFRDLLKAMNFNKFSRRPEITREKIDAIMQVNQKIRNSMELFYERYAWAAALRLLRKESIPIGDSDASSILEFVRARLDTYSVGSKDSRFTYGVRSPQNMIKNLNPLIHI